MIQRRLIFFKEFENISDRSKKERKAVFFVHAVNDMDENLPVELCHQIYDACACSTGGWCLKAMQKITRASQVVIISLSYGDQVDWLRNILAAGGCEIMHRKERLIATNTEVKHSHEAINQLPEKRRRLFERFKLEKFLRMQIINQ